MSTLKKTLAIFLTVCMLAGMLPVGTAFAANDIPADGAMPLGDSSLGGPEIGDIPAGVAGHKHSWNKETGKCDGCGELCKHETSNVVAGKAATCELPGLSEGKVCATCGKITAEQTATPVAAHAFGEDGKCTACGKQNPATEGADGKKTTGSNPGGQNSIPAANGTAGTYAATGEGGADPSTCEHLKDVDGAPVSAFKNGTCEVCGFTCTSHTWNSGGVCTVCGTECEHTWNELSDGSTYRQCSKCNAICNHLGWFDHDGLCQECGYQCVHPNNWAANSLKENTMTCNTCGAVCEHKKTGTDGTETSTMEGNVCTVCGFRCPGHRWTTAADKPVCSICGAACTHPAASAAAADPIPATCTETGREAGTKCGVCGAYTAGGAETEALGHKWNYTDPARATCDNGCGETCSHVEDDSITKAFNADTGVCRVCEYPCVHTFENGVCTICSYVCKHENLTEGTCDDCRQSFEAMITGSDGTSEYYSTLSAAVNAVADGDTIKLLKASNVESSLTFHANNSVLDLNGYTLARSENNDGSGDCAIVVNGGSLTVKNGTVTANGRGDAGVICAQGGASLTIESGVTVDGKANHAVVVAGNGTKAYISGTLLSDGQTAITGNGAQGGTTIEILKNAVLTSTNGTAIYHPQSGTLNIKGGTITGGQTGVEVRAGTVNISGGEITGGQNFSCAPNESGLTTKGAGLAVVQNTTGSVIRVSISDGTISGKRAIHEENPELNPPSALQEVSISVTGGELIGEVYSRDDKITFSGGAAKDGFTAAVQAANGAVTVDNGFINAGATNTIDVKASDGKPVTDVTLPTKAIIESASSGDTTIRIVTDVAEVTLDNAAINAIKNAVAPNNTAAVDSVTLHVKDLSQTKQEKTFEVYIQGADGNKIGSGGPGSFGGDVQVVLKGIETKPAQVRHYDENDSFLELPEFKYDPASKTVTVTINHFSFLTLSQKAIPVINTAAQLPNAQAGKGYYTKIDATGEPAPTFTVDPNLLPEGLALDTKTGEIKGTVDPGARTGAYSFEITAANSEGLAKMTYRLTVDKYVAAKLYDTEKNGMAELGSYGTVQEAINAAQDDQTVALVEDSTDNVLVEGKNIFIEGDNSLRRKLGNITVRQKDGKGVVGITDITSDKLTVLEGAGAALGVRCYIKTVENKNPYDEVTKTAYVYIVGGTYGQLLPAKGGSYQVTGGTFETAIPMEYCRQLDENGNFVKQYYARKNSVSSLYDIAPFTFEITKVSNSGYHMPGSQKTLVFSTNLDYTLADRDRASSSITITSGNSSKAISSVYYDISEGRDGKAEITLKASTLNALSLGRYRMQYKGPTGTDYMYFHISNTVRTGDTSNIGLWLGIMGGSVVVLCAVAAVLVVKSKKKNGGAKTKEEKK